MAKKARKKSKHLRQRTSVSCRTVQRKRSMTRLVGTSEGVQIDLTGKLTAITRLRKRTYGHADAVDAVGDLHYNESVGCDEFHAHSE